jgi:lipid-binding SYLF domain-containing protein
MSKWCVLTALACSFAACTIRAPTPEAQLTLEQQAAASLSQMEARDPGLTRLLASSAGYAVFPDIGAAGALFAGGAFGRGILYEHGVPSGYVEIRQGSVGPQLGGQTYAELLVLRGAYDIERLKTSPFDLGAHASAVVLTAGAAASARFESGVSVFVSPRGGLMAGVSITGQQVAYHPLAG